MDEEEEEEPKNQLQEKIAQLKKLDIVDVVDYMTVDNLVINPANYVKEKFAELMAGSGDGDEGE